MLASENVMEQALAQVFDGQPVNVDMTLTEINAAWVRLGLRKSDLRDVISKMVASRCLVARSHSGSPGFALTEHGAQRFSIYRHQQGSLQAWLKRRRELQPKEGMPDLFGDS